MSEQARLLTQSEIGRVNELLNVLSENLFFHRNSSLAKGHSLSLMTSPYYDSGGDRLSSYVLRITVEPTPGNLDVVYAPADLVSTYNTKIPVGGAGIPSSMPTSLGISHTTSGPDGTTNSPGIPQLDSNILTRYTEDLIQDLEIADAVLKAHALLNHGERNPQPHYGISVVGEELRDTLGHIMGGKVVKITLGNRQYKLPCDNNITGPYQGPRIISHPVDQQSRDDSLPLPTKPFSVEVGGGDTPFSYQWQYATVSVPNKFDPLLELNSSWGNLVTGDDFVSPRFSGAVIRIMTGADAATMTCRQVHTHTDNKWIDPAMIFRCKVTSASGKSSYSNTAKLRTYDKTGC